MRKFLVGAAFLLIATPASAQYYGGGGYGGGYHAPRYRTVCHYERVYVTDSYGYGRYVNQRICKQVAY